MPLLTLLRSGASSGQSLQFVDETNNPLPAGTVTTVYGGATQTAASLVGSTTLIAGGFASNAALPLQAGGAYSATFTGQQAPQINCSFTYTGQGLTQAVVYGYRSPCLSTAGYAQEMVNLWPTGPGWFSDAAKVPGGVAYPVAYGLSAQVAALDAEAQQELGRLRLQTCLKSDIDTWAADFLGQYITRPPGASDQQWRTLIYACLQTPTLTIAGIQAIVTAWLPFIISEFTSPQALFLDASGSLDDSGGFLDSPTSAITQGFPTVLVFDAQSNPTLSNALFPPITPDSCKFAVYFRYPGYTDATIQTISSFSPLLTSIVGLWKAAGTIPVFAANT